MLQNRRLITLLSEKGKRTVNEITMTIRIHLKPNQSVQELSQLCLQKIRSLSVNW